MILSIFFVGNIDASIYSNNTSKNNFILTPGMIAYQNGLNNTDAIGGSDFRIKDNVVVPAYSISSGEEGGSFDDIKNKDRISYYIVQSGDNVAKIAKKFGISKETIIWENNLNSKGFLKLKQKLTILPVSGIRYTIKKGDSLAKIAKTFSVDLDTIKSFNDLNDDTLKIGEIIIIPGGKKISSAKKVVKKKNVSTKKKSYYSKKTSVKKTSSRTATKSKSSLSKIFKRPSTGRFTSPFGPRWGRMHYGVDFAQSRGSSIVASAAGTVSKVYRGCRVGNSKCGGGFGNYVEITHSNGYKTRYAHLIKTNVSKGQKVVQGQLIGGMGNTGHVFPKPRNYSSTAGTHLHFEILKGNSRINPNFLR